MKKLLKRLSVSALCVIIMSCSQPEKSTKGFQINGATTIKTSMAYLINNEQKIIDSAKISGHKFSFEGVIDSPSFYAIEIKNRSQKVDFIIENSDFTIAIAQKHHVIIGGKLQGLFALYKNQLSDLQNIKSTYLKQLASNSISQFQFKIDSLQSLEQTIITQHIAQNLNNDISTFIFKNNLSKTLNTKLLSKLKSIAKGSKNTTLIALIDSRITIASAQEEKLAQEAAQKRALVKKTKRQPAPLFYGESLLGGDLSLQTVLNGKKAVLIDFWASWCGPCRQITPIVKNLHQKYKDQGFAVITVSEDKTRDAWRNGVMNDGMSAWNHIFDDYMRIAYMFNVASIPHMVLLDGNGGIVQNKISINDLELEIQKLVK